MAWKWRSAKESNWNQSKSQSFKDLREKKIIPTNDDRFTTAIDKLGSSMYLAARHFSLCISNDIEPYLVLPSWTSSCCIFIWKVEGASCIPFGWFVESEVLVKKDTVGKMLRLLLTDVNNLRAVKNFKVGSAATLVCKKAKATHEIGVRQFKMKFRGALGKKIEKKIPVTLQIHSHQPILVLKIMICWQIYLVSYVYISLNAIEYQICVPIVLKPLINLSWKAMLREIEPLRLI